MAKTRVQPALASFFIYIYINKKVSSLMEIKIEVIGKEFIKPCSPTPSHLKTFRFSRYDQGVPLCYTSAVLFYNCPEENQMEWSKHLKESLSKVLTWFYPFSGRIKDSLSIDCNDEGADFLEARVNCPLSYLLERPNLEAISHLVPMESGEMVTEPLLFVQVSLFVGGGMALGVNISHKIADGTTLCTVINAWAEIAIGKRDMAVPNISVADLYPPNESTRGDLYLLPGSLIHNDSETMRIMFDASKLTALKAKVEGTENPTRVEVVLALLWKCALKASLELNTSSHMPHAMIGAVNLRSSLVPPIPKYACGNVLEALPLVISDETKVDFSYIVSLIRKVKTERRGLPPPDYDASVLSLENNRLCFSSRCRMPFYEADFGLGKPTWACHGVLRSNGFYLMDSQDSDGIEAWVKLNVQEMALFKKDEELLGISLINPSVTLRT